jgi:Ala-tRNA(Pro) deacylase
MTDRYEQLIELLNHHHASYRLIDHAPEGRTDIVSPLRGHETKHAAKCMIVMVKIGKKRTIYVLAVVSGTARVDLDTIKRLMSGTYVSFASSNIAEELAGSAVGTVLPFAFDERLVLIADPELMQSPKIYFNAARLDRSVELDTRDYLRIAQPRLERIARFDTVAAGQ